MSAGALRGIALVLVVAGVPCLGPGAAGASPDSRREGATAPAAPSAPGNGAGHAFRVDSYVIGAGGGHSGAGVFDATGTAGGRLGVERNRGSFSVSLGRVYGRSWSWLSIDLERTGMRTGLRTGPVRLADASGLRA